MMRRFHLLLLTTCFFMLIAGVSNAQTVPYKTGDKSWDPDKLGNQRAVVTVVDEGKVAEALVPWRCRTVTPEQLIIVVDAKTGQQITNVRTKNVSSEGGTVDFEPVSGKGTYYIYFLPYQLKKPENYPNAIYKKATNIASDDWAKLAEASTTKAGVKVDYFESYNTLNNLYPMEVIATKAETEKMINGAGQQPYLIFPESRMYPISMDMNLPQRWVVKGSGLSFSDTASRGENFAYQIGIYVFANKLENIKLSFSDLKDGQGNSIPASLMSCLNTDGTSAEGKPLKKTVDVESGHIQAMWCLVSIPATVKPGKYTGTVTASTTGTSPRIVKVELTINDKLLNDGGVNEPWKQTRLAWLNSTMAQKNTVIAPYTPLKVLGNTISLLGRKLTLGANGFPSQISTYFI
ncbi:MAG TPA: glycoside hydrolase domain-containing protein, partial [Mucilaginibacter sp.]|nr:glycoside hydrolase domain-containing protein [Mucilaginibacter sp.]